MKQIDNRQKQHILGRASKVRKGGRLSFKKGKEKTQVPEAADSSSQESDAPKVSSEQTTPFHAESSVGRNEPCPCGSGKKYKKCCLMKT